MRYIKAYSCSCLVHDSRQKLAVCDEKTGNDRDSRKVSRSCWGAQKHQSPAGGEPREEPLNHCTMWRPMDQPMEIVLANRRVEAVDVRGAHPLLTLCPVRVFVRFCAAAQIFHMYDIDTIQDGPDHNVQTVDNRGVLTGKEPPVSKWPLSQRLLCLFRW